MEITAFCIRTHIKRALKKFGIDSSVILDKTFIMGDFNGYFPKDSPFTIKIRNFQSFLGDNELQEVVVTILIHPVLKAPLLIQGI